MKRLALCLMAVVLAGLALPAQATPTLTWGPLGEAEQSSNPVEQQTEGGATQPDPNLWVISTNVLGNNNPQGTAGLRCAWDADDSRKMATVDGLLPPGAAASGTKCWIADWDNHFTYVSVNTKSPDLVVTMRYDPQGYVLTAPARWDPVNRLYFYRVCGFGPDYDALDYPGFEPIPNSGTAPNRYHPEFVGGVGVPSQWTVTISNPTDRTVRDVHGLARFNVSGAPGCPEFSFAWTHLGGWPGPEMWWTVP